MSLDKSFVKIQHLKGTSYFDAIAQIILISAFE